MMPRRLRFPAATLLLFIVLAGFGAWGPALADPGFIAVGQPPVAQFDAHYAYTSVPMRVGFSDRSEGTAPLTYAWDFGDGTTSSDQNPSHTYTREGKYTITLTVTNAFGTDSITRKDLIMAGSGPSADFSADITTAGTGRVIFFTDLSTNSPTSWSWDFGDGTTGAGPRPDHSYRKAGVYSVTLTVGNAGQTSSRTKTGYITVIDLLKAAFVADRTRGSVPVNVSFTDQSAGSPATWKWDFGDGTTSSEQNPVHRYTAPGSYTVSLTISGTGGQDTTTKNDFIVVTRGPVADFRADVQAGRAPFLVRFTDISQGSPTSWVWDFGDGSRSDEQNPVHVYQRDGTYNISLTVKNQYGKDTVTRSGSSPGQPVTVTTSLVPAAEAGSGEPVVTLRTTIPRTTATTKSAMPAGVGLVAVAGAFVLAGAGKRG